MIASAGALGELAARLGARALAPPSAGGERYDTVCCSSTISEALRDASPGCALVIPLGNTQVVRAAALLGAAAVVVCGGCEVEAAAVIAARREELALFATALDINTCRREAADAAARAAPSKCAPLTPLAEESSAQARFPVLGGGYFMAGQASRRVRDMLEAAGVSADIVRRVSIATYEAEMNVVIYAPSGSIAVAVTPTDVQVCVADNGPGIADLEQAMRPGYSTAPEKARAMGFGAGMGLPNIARSCDELSIETGHEAGGTRIVMRFRREQREGARR